MKIRFTLIALVAIVATTFSSPVFATTPIQEVKSKQGITAWLMEDHTNPLIAVSFMIRNGASSDPKNLAGLTTFLSGMMDEGAGDMDSRSFQKALEDNSISLGFSAGRDSFSGRLQTLTQHKDKAFELLHLSLTENRFDSEPLERMRDVFQARLRQRAENPGSRAADEMLETLFKGHPYSLPTSGTKEGLQAIQAKHLSAFLETRFTKDQLIISVVGDITAQELSKVLDKTFGDLPQTATLPDVADIDPTLDGKTHFQHMPVPQAVALFAQAGPARNDPDWHAYQVMMYILGDGGFSSRLTEEVREKRGLAYSVGASANPLRHAPLTLGSVGTQTDKIDQSLALIRQEWQRMKDSGPTVEEVKKAKSYIIGSVPLRLNSSQSIASTLNAMQYYHLPKDDFENRTEIIEAITVDDVKRVAQKWLTPDKLTMFVVGDVKQSK